MVDCWSHAMLTVLVRLFPSECVVVFRYSILYLKVTTYLPTYLLISLPTYLQKSYLLSVYPSIYVSVYLPVLSIYVSVYLSVYLRELVCSFQPDDRCCCCPLEMLLLCITCHPKMLLCIM